MVGNEERKLGGNFCLGMNLWRVGELVEWVSLIANTWGFNAFFSGG